MTNFLGQLALAALWQIGLLFGIFFVFGWLLSYLQAATQSLYQRKVGWAGILWTGWLGTPIHELGHLFFALLFLHRIEGLALFKPNRRTGELGYLSHSHNDSSLYQTVGNFFVGAAPLFSGSAALIVLLYWLIPSAKLILQTLTLTTFNPSAIWLALQRAAQLLFASSNLANPWFWLFCYLSFCIASHLAPSPEDRRGIWQGFWLLAFLLICLNAISLLAGFNLTNSIQKFAGQLGVIYAILFYCLLISGSHWLLANIILWPFKR